MYLTLNSTYTATLFIFIIIYIRCGCSLEEGDKCSSSDGHEGTCRLIGNCPMAIALVRSGFFARDICNLKKSTQLVICCTDKTELNNFTTTSTTRTIITTTTRTTTTENIKPLQALKSRLTGDISTRKCREYADYAYDNTRSPTLSIIPHRSRTLECAYKKLTLIVGGTLATAQEFPHMALIGYEGEDVVEWSCGGSLISENFVLTAAHCLKHRQLGSASLVRVGLTNKSDTHHMQERSVSQAIFHPQYGRSKYHDIGLLKLAINVNLNIYARPACLHIEKHIQKERAIASGWGSMHYLGDTSNDLLKVVLEFFSVEKCNYTYRKDISVPDSNLKNGIVDDWMICAGSKEEMKDTCKGDSGGPLQIYRDDSPGIKCMYNIIGITSLGKSCGLVKNQPGVYTRVSAYLKWIEDTVWPN